MDDLRRLIATEDIKQLKARYFRCMDTKDWDGLATVFTPDAVFDLRDVASLRHPVTGQWSPPPGGEEAVFVGRDNVLAMIRASVERLITVHHGHMPEIDITGETSARGVWAMEDVIHSASGEPAFHMHGRGHYHETYERLAAGWAIKTTRITRLHLIRS